MGFNSEVLSLVTGMGDGWETTGEEWRKDKRSDESYPPAP